MKYWPKKSGLFTEIEMSIKCNIQQSSSPYINKTKNVQTFHLKIDKGMHSHKNSNDNWMD